MIGYLLTWIIMGYFIIDGAVRRRTTTTFWKVIVPHVKKHGFFGVCGTIGVMIIWPYVIYEELRK